MEDTFSFNPLNSEETQSSPTFQKQNGGKTRRKRMCLIIYLFFLNTDGSSNGSLLQSAPPDRDRLDIYFFLPGFRV